MNSIMYARTSLLLLACTTAVLSAVAACSKEGNEARNWKQRPDEALGNLVIAPVEESFAIDLERAGKDVDHFFHALSVPHGHLSEILGGHRVSGTSQLTLSQGDATVQELSDELDMRYDASGQFAATLDNSREYGRHAIFDGKLLYLRPRFGRFHARAPQSEGETATIRNEMTSTAADYFDALRKQVEISDRGAGTFAGRAVREYTFQLAPKARKLGAEPLKQRKWRDDMSVTAAKGKVSLDSETGMPLHMELEGALRFERDGKSYTMKLSAKRSITEVGKTQTIEAPSEELVQRIPARHRELDEREALLHRIAPPARRAPIPGEAR